MIDASARQLSDKFFKSLQTHLAAGDAPQAQPAAEQAASQLPSLLREPGHTPSRAKTDDMLALEKIRLLWFFAGVLATSIGVWLGAGLMK